MSAQKQLFKRRVATSLLFLFTLIGILTIIPVGQLHAQEVTEPSAEVISESKAEVMKFGLIGAAIAFGFGAIGAGIAIANVGAAAMGAIGEKPEIASQALIFIALAEGLVVFGFITALMILGKV